MPDTPDNVQNDLVTYFGEKIRDAPHFPDYVNIGVYLSDPQAYGPTLKKLETKVAGMYQQRLSRLENPVFRDYFNTHREQLDKYLTQKLLSFALLEFEQREGFHVGGFSTEIPIIIGNPGVTFNHLLNEGSPFKDIGAGEQHGEFSHRIQWYLLQGCPLQHPIVDIYKNISGFRSVSRKLSSTSTRFFYLWEFLVDRDGMPSNASSIPFRSLTPDDMRAPSNLNHTLMDNRSGTWPFLSFLLNRRASKRHHMDFVLYIAKKSGRSKDATEFLQHFFQENLQLLGDFVQEHKVMRRGA